MGILTRIAALCEQANSNYHFEFENDFMMNVKADNVQFPVVHFEEYTESRYNTSGYGLALSTLVELHIYKLAPMQASAVVREQLREEMQDEFILPFIDALTASGLLADGEDITAYPEPTIFDANATGVMLRFWVKTQLCR